MNKYFNKFLKINVLKVNSNFQDQVLLVDRYRLNQALVSSFYIYLINKKYKLSPVVLSDELNNDIISLYKSFGIKKFIDVFNFKMIIFKPIILFTSLVETFKSIRLIKNKGYKWFIDKFEINKIYIGDLIYDEYIRNYQLYSRENKLDIRFISILFKGVFRLLNIENIFKKNRIRYVVLGTDAYANNGGITLRVALKKKIKVIEPQIKSLDFFEIKDHHITHGKNSIYYQNKLKILKNYEKKINKIDDYLKKRYLGKVSTNWTRTKDLKKTNRNINFLKKKQLLKLFGVEKKNFKKLILFSCHAFSDANHGAQLGKKLLFNDYYDHLKLTLEYLNECNNKDVLVIVRPNPTSYFNNEFENIRFLVKKLNNKNIIISPPKISSYNLIKVCDHVITSRGTTGMEFACEGKRPIIAGAAVYSKLGFSMEFSSRKEYFKALKNITNIKPLSKNQIILAKKTLYFLENNVNKKNLNFNDKNFIFDEFLIKKIVLNNSSMFCPRLINKIKKFKYKNNTSIQYITEKI